MMKSRSGVAIMAGNVAWTTETRTKSFVSHAIRRDSPVVALGGCRWDMRIRGHRPLVMTGYHGTRQSRLARLPCRVRGEVVKILLADDHDLIRETLVLYLGAQIDAQVVEVGDVAGAGHGTPVLPRRHPELACAAHYLAGLRRGGRAGASGAATACCGRGS